MPEPIYIVTQNHASKPVIDLLEKRPEKQNLQVWEIDDFLTQKAPFGIPPQQVIPLLLTCGKAYEALKPFTTHKPLIFDTSSAEKWAHVLVRQQPTLWIGHGDRTGRTAPYYNMLEKQMQKINAQQVIFLLSDDLTQLKTVIKPCGEKILLRSLFLTDGYHARFSMNEQVKNELVSLGIELVCETTPLLAYSAVVDAFLAVSEV